MALGARLREEIPDEELAARFAVTGDGECFEELFARHRKRIYFACRGFFGNGGMAEDATQETFLRAFQNMDRFHGGNFAAWLSRIGKNVCIDEWRKRRPEAEIGGDEVISDAKERATSAAASRLADLSMAAELLREQMRELPREQRECLEMKTEGYSYEETAARMGMPVEAVKSHIQNGRRMLWLKMGGALSQIP
jgi:RNA polymerase sigma-70 factor, ECF subfamily